ncbi:MAG: energy transducer TonB [Flavobacteriaceae bacterium]|nr:energy transducer TonB [Flavobacteriaceae bacterium]
MKPILIIFFALLSTSVFAQEDWGKVDKNVLTLKEIAPIWPGCEKGSANERDNCFNSQLANHIAKNFKYPAKEYRNKVEGKVIVDFIINEEGMVEVRDVSGGTPALQAEAKRNILAIPKMVKPGMMGGKPRTIKYKVPFNFKTGK